MGPNGRYRPNAHSVIVKENAEASEGKDALRATETTIGKGRSPPRDTPQSVTVVTEKLMDNCNLDTVNDNSG